MIAEGALIVSCQASPGSPFFDPRFIRAFAQAALLGGAAGVRLEGLTNIAAVRQEQRCPIIGLVKRRGGEVYITPETTDVQAVAEAGADIIAFDATLRPRLVSVRDLTKETHRCGKLALADIATVADAEAALEAGADMVGTTLSGYTDTSPNQAGPDFALISDLAALGIRPLAEGRIRTPDEAEEALARGAFAVVVGSAITRPEVVTGWFATRLHQVLRPA